MAKGKKKECSTPDNYGCGAFKVKRRITVL
jgi:hypothetical protein